MKGEELNVWALLLGAGLVLFVIASAYTVSFRRQLGEWDRWLLMVVAGLGLLDVVLALTVFA